ncbi:MAG TPA: YbhB/YbcL family Raf kinase inhibitor-like protein [Rhodanobacteraceae bacterium]
MTKILTLLAMLALSGVAHAGQFSLHVDAADAHGHVRPQFVYNAGGCHGQDVSPKVAWSDPPKGTQGFALTVYDPDAKGGWWHWMAVDIPPITRAIQQDGTLPPGAYALTNSFGHARWDGPCPPGTDAPHHYVFTLYALDTPALGADDSTTPEAAKALIQKHAIGKASVTFTYGRQSR